MDAPLAVFVVCYVASSLFGPDPQHDQNVFGKSLYLPEIGKMTNNSFVKFPQALFQFLITIKKKQGVVPFSNLLQRLIELVLNRPNGCATC
jgi:hypothetical protein